MLKVRSDLAPCLLSFSSDDFALLDASWTNKHIEGFSMSLEANDQLQSTV